MSAIRACDCARVLPWPWPLSYSSRISTGLPLDVAAANRAPAFSVSQTSTRVSLTPCASRMPGYGVPSRIA
jgi:hypothetical protein